MSDFTNDNSNNTNEISDDMLLRAVAGGAEWAMNPLVERYNRYLYSLIYHIVSDVQVTEDLMQEVFVLIWRRADSTRQQRSNVRRWLTSIARNRTIDYLRSTQRRVAVKASLEDVDKDEHMAQPGAEEEALRTIQGQKVQEALMQIPPEQRMVIGLSYFRGWSQSEIAKNCNIPLGTVKARTRLGTERLKRELERMGITKFDH